MIATNAYTDLRRFRIVLMQLRLELRVQEASKDGHALNFAFSGIPVGSRWTLGAGQERLAQEVQRALEVPHVGCPFFFGTSANCQKHKASAATDWTFPHHCISFSVGNLLDGVLKTHSFLWFPQSLNEHHQNSASFFACGPSLVIAGWAMRR